MAASPLHASGGAVDPSGCSAGRNRLRVPVVRISLPGPAAMSRVPALLPAGGTGRPLPPLRRGGGRRRSRRGGGGVMPLEKETRKGRMAASDPRPCWARLWVYRFSGHGEMERAGQEPSRPAPSPRPLGRRSGPSPRLPYPPPRRGHYPTARAQAATSFQQGGTCQLRPPATADLRRLKPVTLHRSKQAYPPGWVGHSRASKWAIPGSPALFGRVV
jgi:hypothetical protein